MLANNDIVMTILSDYIILNVNATSLSSLDY